MAHGSNGNDVMEGTAGNDILEGGAGDDSLIGGAGDDALDGGSGNDSLEGDAGDDRLLGGTGDDTLNGGLGDDSLDGGTGNDNMSGGLGNDTYMVDSASDVVTEAQTLRGGTDRVVASIDYTLGAYVENLELSGSALRGTGNALNNLLTGNAGNNVLSGGRGDDHLEGNAGDDRLLGGTGDDTLNGGLGDDSLDGGTGNDNMSGGLGNDTYMVDSASDVVTEAQTLRGGTDRVVASIDYTLGAYVENLELSGSALRGTGNALNNLLTGNAGNNVLSGGRGDDHLEGNAGDDRLLGGTGDDTLNGGLGDDSLDGGTGNDNMSGGLGNDTYMVDSASDVVTEAQTLRGGTDRVVASIDYTLGAYVENLELSGSALRGTGNALNNLLTGNAGNNVLSGGRGDDHLEGNAGDDRLLGGTGDDTLNGGLGDDSLDGGTGNDSMSGGLGNDTYMVDRGAGQDRILDNDGTVGNSDRLLYGTTVNPLDLVLSRQVDDLRIAIHGSTDEVTIQNWYSAPTTAQVETIQAGNGQQLLNTQVDQLIQAMAGFTQQTGLTWDQAIDAQPQAVQTVLAANWQ